MKLSCARLLLALFLVAVLILGTRLVWVASTAETGWETLGLSSYNALLAPIGLEREPIGNRDPAEQAEIWLREVDRVIVAHPDDAQIAMGAAWMLDSPGSGFRRKHTKVDTLFLPLIMPKVDEGAVARAEGRYEAKCAARCLELATRATELEPDNVDWWRMRTLLLFRERYSGSDLEPRRLDWLATLDECAQRDPENSLYDYLAALRLWSSSGEPDWDPKTDVDFVRVDDPEQYTEGIARFGQGQRKKYLAVGAAALPPVAEFLRHSRQPRKEEADVGLERLAGSRARTLLMELCAWQRARAGTREQEGDAAGALAIVRQQRRALKQAAADEDSPELRSLARLLRPRVIETIERLAKNHPGLISVEELAAIEAEVKDAFIDVYVSSKASGEVDSVSQNQQFPDTVARQVSEVTQPLCLLMLMMGTVAWGIARWLLKAGQPLSLGAVRHLSAWVVGWGVTFFILGMCPAETLNLDLQATIIAAGTSLLGIAMLWVGFRTLVSLFQTSTQPSEPLPMVCFVAVLTLWQATVAAVLTAFAPFSDAWSFFVVSQTIQSLVPYALPAALIVAAWAVLRYRRRRGRLPWAHLAAIGLMAVSALLVTGAFALDPHYLGKDCWPPVSDWEGVDGAAVNSLLNETYNASWLEDLEVTASDVTAGRRFFWASCQWQAHIGLLISPGVSLLLVGLWLSARRSRQRRQAAPGEARPNWRAYCGGLLHCLARSALAMAACCLLVHLAVAPDVLRAVENDYQRKIAYVRDPQGYSERIRKAEAAIRNDPAAMEEIRAQVAAEMARYEDALTDDQSETDP